MFFFAEAKQDFNKHKHKQQWYKKHPAASDLNKKMEPQRCCIIFIRGFKRIFQAAHKETLRLDEYILKVNKN